MNCQEYRKYLSPYSDSEPDIRTCANIARHLLTCVDCSSLFAQEQLTLFPFETKLRGLLAEYARKKGFVRRNL